MFSTNLRVLNCSRTVNNYISPADLYCKFLYCRFFLFLPVLYYRFFCLTKFSWLIVFSGRINLWSPESLSTWDVLLRAQLCFRFIETWGDKFIVWRTAHKVCQLRSQLPLPPQHSPLNIRRYKWEVWLVSMPLPLYAHFLASSANNEGRLPSLWD